MSSRKYFTLSEMKTIETELRGGKTCSVIAKMLNRSKAGIVGEVRKGGGREKYNAETRHLQAFRAKTSRTVGFSEKQKATIMQMVHEGRLQNDIRYKIGCSYEKLNNYLIENGLKKQVPDEVTLMERMDALEMQLQILTEQIKEILCKK